MFTKDATSSLKLIDFGVSASVDPEKRLTETVGTVLYIAPEVLNKSYN